MHLKMEPPVNSILLRRLSVAMIVSLPLPALSHDWHWHAADPVNESPSAAGSPPERIRSGVARYTLANFTTESSDTLKPAIAAHFEHFGRVKVRWNDTHLIIESDGLPEHNMMVGIRSWQQQVPLPQPFTGANAWQVPLKPRLALEPISAKRTPMRGAIALAVNGVPMFSPLNNRGEDAFLAGELDRWGGHCGRGDDYHYHAAPVHLEAIVGKGNPIGFALDGFPIYGLTEPDGSAVGKLDELNGQFDRDGNYHYHATKTYPYINGGLRGVVTLQGDQIVPQPRDAPVRPAMRPLRDAVITDFSTTGSRSVLTYRIRNQIGTVSFSPDGDNAFQFNYREPSGRSWTEVYQRRNANERGGRRPQPRDGSRPPPPRPRR